MRPSRTAAVLATLSLGTYACGDTPAPLAPPKRSDLPEAEAVNTTTFMCSSSRRDPDDPSYYHYGRIRFHIPRRDAATADGLVTYRVYFQNPGADPAAVLNCRLPNSPAVLDYMNKRVARVSAAGHSSNAAAQPGSAPASSSPAAASGPGDLQVIVVIVPAIAGYLGGGGGFDYYRNGWGPDASHEDTGGGSYYEPPPACDQKVDPSCEVPLSSTDRATLDAAFQAHVRVPGTIADTAHRRLCLQLTDQLNSLFSRDAVFRGAYATTQTDTIKDGPDHYGSSYLGHIHIDPDVMDNATAGVAGYEYIVARNLLHEAAHTLDLFHPNGRDSSGNYIDSPFNLLGTGPDQCLK